jgi:hypothetical protein
MFFDKILSGHFKELRCPTKSLQHALLCSAKSLYRSPPGRYLFKRAIDFKVEVV